MIFMQYVIHSLAALASFSTSSFKYIEDITKTYFSGESVLFIYWSNVSMEFRYELMEYWVKSEIVTVETCNCDFVTDDIIWERTYVKNTVVLFGDLMPEQRHIESLRQCVSWNARSKILAIVNDNDNIANVTLEKIWTFTKAMNVTVMVATTSSVKYYTSYPYQNFQVAELDQDGLFPSKSLDNLHGSVIKIASTECEPFVLIPEIPYEYTDGLEVRIINNIATKYNFQTKYIRPPNGESPWAAQSYGKIIGSLGLLHRCEADLLIHCAQVSPDQCNLADDTTVHSFDSLVWVVPVRPFKFNWRSIIIVFQNELWAVLFSTLIVIVVMLYLITKYEVNSPLTSYNIFDPFFQAIGIYLEVPIHFYRRGQLYRFFLFGISYFSIVIVALYRSSLITYLTRPGSQDQYNTIEEAVDDGLIAYLFTSGKPMYNITDHNLWSKILRPGRHVFSENSCETIGFVARNKTVYTLDVGNYVNVEVQKKHLDENGKPMVRILPDIFLPYLITIFTSKGHPLRDLIRDKVMQLFESGVLKYWMRDILRNLKSKGGSNSIRGNGPMALSVEQLMGAFYILLVLFAIAGMVFIAEVVCDWRMVKRKKEWRFRGREILKRQKGSSRNLSGHKK